MKTKLIAILAVIIHGLAFGQPYTVDTTTPQFVTNGSSVYTVYGDSLAVAFQKMNSNSVYFQGLSDAQAALIVGMSNNILSLSNTLWSATNAQTQIATNAANITILGIMVSNSITTLGQNLTNMGYFIRVDTTNLVAATGLDLTNRIAQIQAPGSSGSEFVLKFVSPDGTTWYQHVDNSGTQTVTGSP